MSDDIKLPPIEIIPEAKSSTPINFKCYEVIGTEIYEDMDPICSDKLVPVIRPKLQDGEALLVPWNNGYMRMTVKNDMGKYYLSCKSLMACLEFDKDDRHCWAAIGFINPRALQILTNKENTVK